MVLRRFNPTPTKSGINIVEWSLFNAYVLDFYYVYARITSLIISVTLARKMAQILFFSAPLCGWGWGHIEEIGRAKALLGEWGVRL